MKEAPIKYTQLDEKHVKADLPKELVAIYAKGIDQLLESDLSKVNLTYLDISSLKLRVLKNTLTKDEIIIDEHISTILDDLEVIFRRSFESWYFDLEQPFLLTLQEWDVLDQFSFHIQWTNDKQIQYPEDLNMFTPKLILQKFSDEILEKRKMYNKLLGHYGFGSRVEGWSKKSIIDEKFIKYEWDFYWKANRCPLAIERAHTEIGVIVNPTNDTMMAFITHGCIIGCCGKPFGIYPVSEEGVNELLTKAEEDALPNE